MPTGSLLKRRAPEFSRWLIAYNPEKTAPAKTPNVEKTLRPGLFQNIVVSKTKDIIFEQIVMSNGQQRKKWCLGDIQFLKRSANGKGVLIDRNAFERGGLLEGDFSDFSTTDFPGFGWVGPRNYRNIVKFMNRDCLLFTDRINLVSDEEFQVIQQDAGVRNEERLNRAQFEMEVTAYVDLETRLPVMLQRGKETSYYQFQSPPESTITIPAELQEMKDHSIRRRNQLSRMPSRPW